jgi:hypothetical protein
MRGKKTRKEMRRKEEDKDGRREREQEEEEGKWRSGRDMMIYGSKRERGGYLDTSSVVKCRCCWSSCHCFLGAEWDVGAGGVAVRVWDRRGKLSLHGQQRDFRANQDLPILPPWLQMLPGGRSLKTA